MNNQRRIAEDLLVRQLTEALSEAEEARLAELLAESPEIDRDAFEQAAATVFLAACANPAEAMPATLRARLQLDAAAKFGSPGKGRG